MGDGGDFDEVGDWRRGEGVGEVMCYDEREEGNEEGGEEGGFGLCDGLGDMLEKVDGGIDGFGVVLDFGVDGEVNV